MLRVLSMTRQSVSDLAIRSRSEQRKILLNLIESIEGMQRTHRKLGIGGVDQHRELDLGGGDGADVDFARGERRKGRGGDAGMAAHAAADHRDLGNVGGAVEPRVAYFALRRSDGVAG